MAVNVCPCGAYFGTDDPAVFYCKPSCREEYHRRLLRQQGTAAPMPTYSVPVTVMRDLQADRRSAPRGTTSVAAGFARLAELSAEAAAPERRRVLAGRDKAIGALEKRRPDLTN